MNYTHRNESDTATRWYFPICNTQYGTVNFGWRFPISRFHYLWKKNRWYPNFQLNMYYFTSNRPPLTTAWNRNCWKSIRIMIFVQPKSCRFIKLSSSSPYVMPVINPNYFSHSDDIKTTLAALKLQLSYVNTAPFCRREDEMNLSNCRPMNAINLISSQMIIHDTMPNICVERLFIQLEQVKWDQIRMKNL